VNRVMAIIEREMRSFFRDVVHGFKWLPLKERGWQRLCQT